MLGGTDILIPDEVRALLPYIIPFGFIGLWRWSLHVVRIICWLLYRPVYPKRNRDGSSANRFCNRYKTSDVTIIVPTIDTDKEFQLAVKSWMLNDPFEVIIITSQEMENKIRACARSCSGPKKSAMFRVLSVPRPNKRVQLMKGIMAARTALVALSDDDAIWTPNFLRWMVAPFDDPAMGGVGSRQEMVPVGSTATLWEVIADFRLTMRMMEASATTFVDGGMSCLSGRTAVYRTRILADPSFGTSFVNEKWLGRYRLHSGDDKFLTRWIVSKGWGMQLQNHKEALLLTTFKDNSTFLKQVLRWTRNTWRSDLRSLFIDRKIWRKRKSIQAMEDGLLSHRYLLVSSDTYVAFNMCDKLINPLPIIYSLVVIGYNMVQRTRHNYLHILIPVFAWIMLSRFLKLLPHVIQKPRHLPYIPVMVLFQYGFPFLKLYALCTLHITDWGSRAGVDTGDFNEDDWHGVNEDSMDPLPNTEEESGLNIDYEDKELTTERKLRNVFTLALGWLFLMLTVVCLGLLVFYTYDAITGE